jgi:putative inorganic carbon (hco3(-)) transporter
VISNSERVRDRRAGPVTLLVVAAAAGLAALSGISAGGDSKLAVVLPLAAAFGLGLGVLALTRFELYVLVMLACRASIDLAKLSGGGAAGAGGSATATTAGATATRALDPSSILGVLFLLAALLWLAAQRRERGQLPGSGLRAALLWFTAASFVSVVGAARPLTGAVEAVRILTAVTMFVVLEQLIRDWATLRRVLLAAYLSMLFPIAYTLLGFATGGPASEVKGGLTRITGPFSQSNTFGRYLMVMIVFGAAILPYVARRLKLALGGILAVSSVLLLLTYTRTALVGTVVGLLVVGVIQSKRLVLVLVVALACALLLVPQLSSRFTSLASAGGAGPTSNNSLTWRLDYWTQVLPLANENPVTGIGLDQTQFNTDQAKQPHNDFIRAYVETGVVGLLAFLAMLAALLVQGTRAVRASPPRSLGRAIGAGFLGCAVAYVAVSAAANVVSNVVMLWYLFTFAAAAGAVVRLSGAPPAASHDSTTTVRPAAQP